MPGRAGERRAAPSGCALFPQTGLDRTPTKARTDLVKPAGVETWSRVVKRLLLALLCAAAVAQPVQASPRSGSVLLGDGFDGRSVHPSSWHIPTWVSPTDGTYVGRTQFRVTQNAMMPGVAHGDVELALETYNPTGFSFYGTDLISDRAFTVGNGLAVQVRAKMDTPTRRGLVGGIFLYALEPGSTTLHDEIDFELLGNDPTHVHTNVYAGEPLGAGRPAATRYAAGTVTDYHDYEIRWLPGEVSWYVDGSLVRRETRRVPSTPMNLHLNIWAPAADWAQAYDAGLQPVTSPRSNRVWTMGVESVVVARINPPA
ncbi:MAG: family 16 glycosylhydrolase, partial [Candidatus Nanopelagicales bacterium]